MTNYESAISRLEKANTIDQLHLLENSFARLYSAGVLNRSNFLKLDDLLCEKIAKLIEKRHLAFEEETK